MQPNAVLGSHFSDSHSGQRTVTSALVRSQATATATATATAPEPSSVVADFRAEMQRVFDSSQEQLLVALSDPGNTRNQLPRVFKRLDKAAGRMAALKAELEGAEQATKKAKVCLLVACVHICR